jgi:hypothetical protein
MREAAGKLATLIGSRQRTVTVTARDTNATTPESAVSDAV